MSPLDFHSMERPSTFNHNASPVEVRSSPETGTICSAHSRSPSLSSSSSRSSECLSSFSFSAAQPAHPQFRSAYADEIFQNGKIRPLDPPPSQAFQAITLYADFPSVEKIAQDFEPYTPLIPINYHDTFEPASANQLHLHQDAHAPQHRSHYHDTVEPPRATLHSHHDAPHYHDTFEPALATLRPSKPCKRAFSLLPLRRVCHVNEDESSSPPRKEPFSPTNTQKCTTQKLSHIGSTHSNCHPITKNSTHCGHAQSPFQVKSFTKSPPRVNKAIFFHTPPSPHAIHYKAQRARKESMKKKTVLPYRHGLFACIGY